MAYAEKVPSPSGDYWRGRYKDADGRYLTVRDEAGQVIRFKKKLDAKNAGIDKESDARNGRLPARAQKILFGEWADTWYASLDLAPTTMETYKSNLELHILPRFQGDPLEDIFGVHVDGWVNDLKSQGYSPASISSYRRTLSACLADAVPALISFNPAMRKRGKGRRSGKKNENQAPERVITGPLGMLLIAERMSILTGRDDEFVMVQAMYWDALRIGEAVGLEREYVTAPVLSVRWQLTEVKGKLVRCPPKDDSYGDIDQPSFLAALLAHQMASVPAEPCSCHGKAYVFRGSGMTPGKGTVPLRAIAAAAGVSVTTVASALSGKDHISGPVRMRVLGIAREAGYEPPGAAAMAPHWDRSRFEDLFAAAASGVFRARDGLPARPVPLAGQWPGTRVRGRNCQGRAEWCWVPVAPGITPHGARHSVKTLMEERRIPEVASETRLRHTITGISGRYRHVSDAMRQELTAMLEHAWQEALDARLQMSPRSPVAVLDRVLAKLAESRKPRLVSSSSPETAGRERFRQATAADELGIRDAQ